MYRPYWVYGLLVLIVFSYAQYQGWSLGGDDSSRGSGSRGSGGHSVIFHK
jgi:hypothetical protein